MTEFERLVLKKLDDLDDKIDAVAVRLDKHMDDEEGEINRMSDRFSALQQTVSSYGDKTGDMLKDMQKAFLEHPEEKGQRDYSGHYNDHLVRKRWYDKWTKWIDDGVGNMIKIAMASGTVWLLYEIWRHLADGPGK